MSDTFQLQYQLEKEIKGALYEIERINELKKVERGGFFNLKDPQITEEIRRTRLVLNGHIQKIETLMNELEKRPDGVDALVSANRMIAFWHEQSKL